MPRRSFLWQLYLAFSLIIFLATASIQIFSARRIAANGRAALEESLRARALFLADLAQPGLAGAAPESLQAAVLRLGRETATRLTVIAADGRVLAESHKAPALLDNHASRPEILEARQRGSGLAVRHSDTVHTEMLYYAFALRDGSGALTGYVRAGLPLTEVDRHLAQLRGGVRLGAAIAGLAALLLGWVIVHHLTQPLTEIQSALAAFATGDFSRRLHLKGGGEFAELASVLNGMARELQLRIERISQERNRLEAVLAGMVEGVIAVDREERILHLNQGAARLLEVERAGSIGRPAWEVARVPAVSEALARCLRDQCEVEMEIRRTGEDGKERIIELYGSPLGANGSPGGAVLVLHEVTELRRLEHIRRDFVANVSHELKTPLTVIRGIVETMQDDPAMAEETRQRFLAKMKSQSDYLSAQVSDLLSLSRLEGPRGQLERAPLDLVALAREVAAVRAPVAESRGLSLALDLPPTALSLNGDRRALEQALGNLLDNALQYTPAGGRVSLRVAAGDTEILCEVADTGIGIAPEHQERIFERFYRVDKARSREQGGTGLGLAIVKHVALAHGGGIALKSSPGQGSVFTLTLPRGA
jgi:two-component system phosphate regulon sensor histidine kinase PhoR